MVFKRFGFLFNSDCSITYPWMGHNYFKRVGALGGRQVRSGEGTCSVSKLIQKYNTVSYLESKIIPLAIFISRAGERKAQHWLWWPMPGPQCQPRELNPKCAKGPADFSRKLLSYVWLYQSQKEDLQRLLFLCKHRTHSRPGQRPLVINGILATQTLSVASILRNIQSAQHTIQRMM